jgi:hypothetical protein
VPITPEAATPDGPVVCAPLGPFPGGGELLQEAISKSAGAVKRGTNEDACIA